MLFDILFFVAAGLVVFAIYKFVFSKKAPQPVKKNDDAPERNQAAAPAQQVQAHDNRQARNARDVRNRFVRNQNVNFNEDAEVEERKENEIPKKKDDNEEGEAVDLRKQQLKEAKKQEKQEQREAFKHALEAKEKKDAEKRNKYEEREKQREEEEKKQEELLKQLEEDEKKRQEEEYAKWKDMFTVDEAGKETDKAASEENLIQKFVHYIKLRKVVMLDDLCAEFKLSTKDVIDRITKLLESKKLTGIIDDRGKFIYITDDEFKAVINFIQKRGRISRSDLVLECNRLIKMNPTEEDKEKLKKEESNLLQQLESDLKAIEEQTA